MFCVKLILQKRIHKSFDEINNKLLGKQLICFVTNKSLEHLNIVLMNDRTST